VTVPSDLTFSQMRDIGWVSSVLPSSIGKNLGDAQAAQVSTLFGVAPSVSTAPGAAGLAVTWTVNPNLAGAGATFAGGGRVAVSTTDAVGGAFAPPLTSNGQPGVYSMNATVPGAGTTSFSLANSAVPATGAACTTDTSQLDFQLGAVSGANLNASPGDVVLLNAPNTDQQNTNLSTSGVGINATTWGGQTFTPNVTGLLTAADINIFCSGCTGTFPNLTLTVRATSGNLPTGADLATATITGNPSGSSSLLKGTFASPATLTAGTTYAILVRPVTNPSAGTYALTRSATDVYSGGQRVSSPDSGATWSAPLTSSQTTDAGFVAYIDAGYLSSGNLVSSPKDGNPPPSQLTLWGTLAWNAAVPAGTSVQFQVGASNSFVGPFNFVGPDGTAATFFTSGASLSRFSGFRYLKYKSLLSTTNGTLTPAVHDVTVCYNNIGRPLDVDDNNAYDAATDGVLIVRYLFGMTGNALTNDAVGVGANPARTGDPALANYLSGILPLLDVDGNGQVDALTDGVMILRSLLGLTGSAITQNAIGPGATRNTAAIELYIQSLRP
jgi:hypothetical protein